MSNDLHLYDSTDLVLVVWPRQSEIAIQQGFAISREEAARGAWAMDREKAERVRLILSIHNDEIIGAWAVTGSTHVLEAPEGKTRRVNRSTFETQEDPRLGFLLGHRSPLGRRRNPQATIELRDLEGAELLTAVADANSQHGVVRLGDYTLTVHEDGSADLINPVMGSLTVRAPR